MFLLLYSSTDHIMLMTQQLVMCLPDRLLLQGLGGFLPEKVISSDCATERSIKVCVRINATRHDILASCMYYLGCTVNLQS